jgi:hypothetical protein
LSLRAEGLTGASGARFALCAGILFAAMLPAGASSPAAEGYVIERYAIHAGGTSRASGGDYELSGTAGQPAPGPSGGGGYTLEAGFIWPLQVAPGEGVFRDGFEGS